MFELDLDWWELVARGAIVYCTLLLMMRLSGRRTVGQFTPFDLLVVMLLSESVSNSLNGGDDSLFGGLIVAATLLVLTALIAFLSSRFNWFERAVEGRPILIGRDGVFFTEVMKRCRLSESDVEEALRKADCPRPDMKCAFLEADGVISVLRNPH